MKWNKYCEFTAISSAMETVMTELIAPAQLNEQVFPTYRDWVRTQVHYIAFRPWETLAMNSTDNRNTRHIVYYHIKNNEGLGGRARFMTDEDHNPRTLQQTIDSIPEWYQMYWAKQPNRPLVYDFVVRKHLSAGDNGYQRTALELFKFPEGFNA